MRFIANVIVPVVAAVSALLCAPPDARADVTPDQAANAICAARGRARSEMDIDRTLQAMRPTVDFYQIEQLVLEATPPRT
jgi:hypothetical protein